MSKAYPSNLSRSQFELLNDLLPQAEPGGRPRSTDVCQVLNAQGTTLALLVPPIGMLVAWTYYKQGYVDVKIAAFIAVDFLVGSLWGAKLAVGLPNTLLGKHLIQASS